MSRESYALEQHDKIMSHMLRREWRRAASHCLGLAAVLMDLDDPRHDDEHEQEVGEELMAALRAEGEAS